MTKPSKERVREWQQDRWKERKPLPDLDQIRRELGMDMEEERRKQQERSKLE